MTTPPDIARLRRAGLDAGLDAVGVTDTAAFEDTRRHLEQRRAAGLHATMNFTYRNPARATEPARLLEGARSLVVGARSYHRAPSVPRTTPVGRSARYAWEDHYAALSEGLTAMADVLRDAGYRAVVVVDDNGLVDRAAAHRAGLGWFGKNTNLLLPGRGSWFVLGSVVTTAALPPNPEPVPPGCGTCTRCLEGCPTGALVEPGVLDANRCLAWLVQAPGPFPARYRVALGDRIYGCDDCQDVCPPNLVHARHAERPAPAGPDAWIPLLDLLDATDEELLERFGRWYIPRRDVTHLRRNALVALGNVGDPDDPAVQDRVATALAHPRPLVRAHAVWAARRLGLDHLLAVVADDGDASVQEELAGDVPRRSAEPASGRAASAVPVTLGRRR